MKVSFFESYENTRRQNMGLIDQTRFSDSVRNNIDQLQLMVLFSVLLVSCVYFMSVLIVSWI